MIKHIVLALALVSSPAFAQDSIDAHGFNLVPNDGGLHDPLRVWQVEEHDRNNLGINLLGEYAYQPVVRHRRVGGLVTESPEITDLTAVNLGVFYSPYSNLALSVAAPGYLSVEGEGARTGLELGDIRTSVSIGIPGISSLAIVPHLDIPGTYPGQYLRSDQITGGGVIAGTVGDESFRLTGNLGIQFQPEVDLLNLTGEERLLSSVAASYAFTDDFALRAEGTFNPSLSRNDFLGTDSPSELTVSAAGYSGERLSWVLGGALPLSEGVGAASARGFLGASWALGSRPDDCPKCDTEVRVVVVTESGDLVDGDVLFTDGKESAKFTTQDTHDWWINMPPGDTEIIVTVPDCELVKVEGGRIILLETVHFDYDEATIRIPESEEILDAVVETLEDSPEITLVEVAGHTDERGSAEYNQSLSQERMEAVVDYLVEQGIDRDRLSPVGYGESKLLREDCGSTDEECHQPNRRVEFVILETESN
jgi:outer membrane protein OmpA-like peptidoglycan-associated protein